MGMGLTLYMYDDKEKAYYVDSFHHLITTSIFEVILQNQPVYFKTNINNQSIEKAVVFSYN